MKSIRDLQKKNVDLSGIVPGTVDDAPDVHQDSKNTGSTGNQSDAPAPVVEKTVPSAEPAAKTEETEKAGDVTGTLETVEQPEIIPAENAPASENIDNKRERRGVKEYVNSVTFTKKDVLQLLLSREKLYNNSNKPIVIDTELKTSLEILSSVASVPISTIVNNLLYMMFNNASDYNLNFEVTEYMIRRQKENINKFKQ